MVNLVKTIESTDQSNPKQMKFLKRQLRSNLPEINKLRQSTQDENMRIAPIHAAAMTENIEILKQILETKDVNVDAAAIVRTPLQIKKFGVIDAACFNSPLFNLDIIKLLLEHVQRPCLMMSYGDSMILLPNCLIEAVENECLELVDILLKNADLLEREMKISAGAPVRLFSPYYCLVVAIGSDKPRVFKHLLQLSPSYNFDLELIILKGKPVSLVEFARINQRTEMCEELENILKENDDEEVKKTKQQYFDGKEEILRKEEAGSKVKDNCNKEVFKRFTSFCSFLQMVPPITQNNNNNPEEANESEENEENTKEVLKKAIRKTKYCWNCQNIGQYLCSGCRKARYCEEKCQWEDWDSHKEYCLVQMN